MLMKFLKLRKLGREELLKRMNRKLISDHLIPGEEIHIKAIVILLLVQLNLLELKLEGLQEREKLMMVGICREIKKIIHNRGKVLSMELKELMLESVSKQKVEKEEGE